MVQWQCMGFLGFGAPAQAVSTDDTRIHELLTRGVTNVIPRDLAQKKLSSGERLRIYFGIDPTGAKLHLGHSVPLRKLRQFADLGHHVIFLVGSFTAMIGDPTGRDAARTSLSEEQVRANFQDYKRQAERVLDFSKAEIRYNNEWLAPLSFSKIVELASSFTVQQMLQRDMFQRRMEEGKPISLHEFLYPLMVGYDSVVLDVDCELGGSDQEFNMLAGRHLQQVSGKREKFVLTTPLIEGTDGRKMSKSYDNCVYLEDDPSDMYGKLMSIKDELIGTYLEVLTDLGSDEIESIGAMHPKEAKMRLAREIVAMYHSKEAATAAEEAFTSTFSEGTIPDDIPSVGRSEVKNMREFIVKVVGISGTAATRYFEQGAIENEAGEKITDPTAPPIVGKYRIGKRQFGKILP